jgi:IBR domain, a half RING-finger domain
VSQSGGSITSGATHTVSTNASQLSHKGRFTFRQRRILILILSRTTSIRQSTHASRPSLQRSATTLRSKSDAIITTNPSRTRSKTAPSVADSHVRKGSSIFSSLLKSSPATHLNLKKVTCLTCGSDNVPIIKTAKLACSHRMCHDCLRRIFTMSVSDPAHMPPKCCTAQHIPLKHVDKLFDQKFKKTWNRKFQEYTTRNRIYCPARQCGEWIKPNHISVENGRKVGKCKRCGTRVCCICNNKMHISRECPKDPATNLFVEVAKKEGWQRCFNCSAMVELKEGCNHMTCRCTAEFCMICGNKWKTCDCPWFNYEAVEADRVEHLNMAHGRRAHNEDDRRAPIRYQEEMDRRRHQERRDAALARRMQVLGMDDDPSDEIGEGGPGQLFGIGNAAEHFLNHDFRQQARDILTGNFRQAARAAEDLLNGAVTGRENPLPPAPFELDAPAATAANQTAQLLRHDTASNATLNNAIRRRSNDQTNARRRAGSQAVNRPANDPAAPEIPLPAPIPNLARRPTLQSGSQSRRASTLGGFLAGGRSQTATERAAEQRIENWRNDVPVGEPADGVTLV